MECVGLLLIFQIFLYFMTFREDESSFGQALGEVAPIMSVEEGLSLAYGFTQFS